MKIFLGLDWPTRAFGGELRSASEAMHKLAREDCSARRGNMCVLYDDGLFEFHSTPQRLCGLQQKRTDDAFIAVWGTPIPQEDQDVFGEFERAGSGDYSRLKYLAGSWIAVVYSIPTRQLRLINDCFGTRPVFYHRERHGPRFSFASDVSHLKDIATLATTVNPDVLASWIWYGYNIATTGILSDAKHMVAGSVLVVDSTGQSEQFPYVTQQDAKRVNSREELIDRFEAVIGWACEYALKTSSCVNLLLSGGWDSRYVLAHLLDRGGNKTNLRLTSVNHYGEAETALKVARAAGLELEIIAGTPYPGFPAVGEDTIVSASAMARSRIAWRTSS